MYLPSRRLVENGPVQEIEHNLQAMNGRSLGADEIEFAVGGDGDGAGGDGDGDGDGAGGDDDDDGTMMTITICAPICVRFHSQLHDDMRNKGCQEAAGTDALPANVLKSMTIDALRFSSIPPTAT